MQNQPDAARSLGRRLVEGGLGFLVATLILTVATLGTRWRLPMFGGVTIVLLAASVILLRRCPRARYLALGVMAALLVPGLVAGSACMSVPLGYDQRPGAPAHGAPPATQSAAPSPAAH